MKKGKIVIVSLSLLGMLVSIPNTVLARGHNNGHQHGQTNQIQQEVPNHHEEGAHYNQQQDSSPANVDSVYEEVPRGNVLDVEEQVRWLPLEVIQDEKLTQQVQSEQNVLPHRTKGKCELSPYGTFEESDMQRYHAHNWTRGSGLCPARS